MANVQRFSRRVTQAWVIAFLVMVPIVHANAGDEFLTQQSLFRSGEGGYHTYRIPALVVAADGTVLAFCEARKNSGSDHGDIDLIVKRSTDHGKTWAEMQILVDGGDRTIGNPCPVLDHSTGEIWLPYCRENNTVHIIHSKDHGRTWSSPREITAQVKPSAWGKKWYATGPTHGIQLSTGRLVIPCDHKVGDRMISHVFYSDDHGQSWKLGGSLAPDTDECGVVELTDGSLLINMRSYRKKNQRTIAHSKDGGLTWGPTRDEPQLIEPVCQGSIHRLSSENKGGRSRILFSNPRSKKRENLTVQLSYDDCKTWTVRKALYRGPSAYSDLATTADGAIICLYERGTKNAYETITLARFNLEWLTDGSDSLKAPR